MVPHCNQFAVTISDLVGDQSKKPTSQPTVKNVSIQTLESAREKMKVKLTTNIFKATSVVSPTATRAWLRATTLLSQAYFSKPVSKVMAQCTYSPV